MRIGCSLERSGLISRDIENAYLAFDPGEEAPINALLGASITYRIATGPREGQKVFTLQTPPAQPNGPRREVAESSGFSLHAGIAAKASQRDKLEHVARYVARPPVATERLSLTEDGQVHCALKTPYRDGTTYVIFESEDFIARLAALESDRLRAEQLAAPSGCGCNEQLAEAVQVLAQLPVQHKVAQASNARRLERRQAFLPRHIGSVAFA